MLDLQKLSLESFNQNIEKIKTEMIKAIEDNDFKEYDTWYAKLKKVLTLKQKAGL